MMSNAERLVYMANQIARNIAGGAGDEAAAAATARHIAAFWDPRMRAIVRELAAAPDSGLSPIAARAIDQLG